MYSYEIYQKALESKIRKTRVNGNMVRIILSLKKVDKTVIKLKNCKKSANITLKTSRFQ